MTTTESRPAAPTRTTALRARVTELASFGLVGGAAYVVDVGVYNLLRQTVLEDKPIGAKVLSVAVAATVAWLGNRHLTFRARRGRARRHEALLFAGANLLGLAVSAACLFVSHYVLGFTSALADNVAGNVVGLLLGTAVRYVAYRHVVFTAPPEIDSPAADVVDLRDPGERTTRPVRTPSGPSAVPTDLAPGGTP